MRFMSREFTRGEKLLLAVLIAVLLGLLYYQFVDKTVRSSIAASEAESKALRTQLDAAEQRLARLSSVQAAMDELEAAGKLSYMGSYNNSKAEVAFLNEILADAQEYSISFADVSRKDDQIRRSFTLQFKTQNYQAAQDIVQRLCNGDNRCLVGDLRCTIASSGSVVINAEATFYETMVGGVADAALPEDRAAANS